MHCLYIITDHFTLAVRHYNKCNIISTSLQLIRHNQQTYIVTVESVKYPIEILPHAVYNDIRI